MEETSLKLTVDAGDAIEKMDAFTQSATAAADAVERLDKAWASLSETLKTLNGAPHGGIAFQMVGDVAQAEIKPASGSKPPISGHNASGAKAFLDGVLVENVMACDPDLGYLLVMPTPGEEFKLVDFDGVVCKRMNGAFTIVMP